MIEQAVPGAGPAQIVVVAVSVAGLGLSVSLYLIYKMNKNIKRRNKHIKKLFAELDIEEPDPLYSFPIVDTSRNLRKYEKLMNLAEKNKLTHNKPQEIINDEYNKQENGPVKQTNDIAETDDDTVRTTAVEAVTEQGTDTDTHDIGGGGMDAQAFDGNGTQQRETDNFISLLQDIPRRDSPECDPVDMLISHSRDDCSDEELKSVLEQSQQRLLAYERISGTLTNYTGQDAQSSWKSLKMELESIESDSDLRMDLIELSGQLSNYKQRIDEYSKKQERYGKKADCLEQIAKEIDQKSLQENTGSGTNAERLREAAESGLLNVRLVAAARNVSPSRADGPGQKLISAVQMPMEHTADEIRSIFEETRSTLNEYTATMREIEVNKDEVRDDLEDVKQQLNNVNLSKQFTRAIRSRLETMEREISTIPEENKIAMHDKYQSIYQIEQIISEAPDTTDISRPSEVSSLSERFENTLDRVKQRQDANTHSVNAGNMIGNHFIKVSKHMKQEGDKRLQGDSVSEAKTYYNCALTVINGVLDLYNTSDLRNRLEQI